MYRPLAQDGVVRRLIEAAGAAPSIHNTQPWRFRVTDELIEVHGDPDRMLWVADPRGRALHLSCGAALFNLRVAIRMLGAKPLVWPLPDPVGKPTLLASVELEPGRPPASDERTMFDAIYLRHTSRAPFSEVPIPESVRLRLEQEAAYEFAVFRMLNASDASAALDLAATAEQELAADFSHRVELGQWIGTEGDDGIPGDALGYRPVAGQAPVRDFGYAPASIVRPSGRYERQPQLAVLATSGDRPGDWLRAGQALERVLLASAGVGLATSLLYQQVELHDVARRGGKWWPWPEWPQIIIRLGYGPAGKGSPRRGVDDILDRQLPGLPER
jgi:nitroreductase